MKLNNRKNHFATQQHKNHNLQYLLQYLQNGFSTQLYRDKNLSCFSFVCICAVYERLRCVMNELMNNNFYSSNLSFIYSTQSRENP